MAEYSYQYNSEIQDGPSYKVYRRHLIANFDALNSAIGDRLRVTTGGAAQTVADAVTCSSAWTFNSGILSDTIGEKTAAAGVTIDGVKLKDTGIILADAGELTIASGAITITGTNHTVDTESDAASDDLDTINGGVDGKIIVLSTENDSRDVVIKHNTGNIFLSRAADYTLGTTKATVTLLYSGALSKWIEIGRSDLVAATQTEMEAASSNAVSATPGNIKWHPGVLKGAARFNGTGTLAVDSSYNVSSVVDSGTGVYTVNWDTDFSSANWYGALAANGGGGWTPTLQRTGQAAGSCIIETFVGNTGSASDNSNVHIVAFGDQ